MPFTPFSECDNHSAFQGHLENIRSEIRNLDNSYVLQTPASELETIYLQKVHANPLILKKDEYYIDGELSVQVDARLIPNVIFMPGDRPRQVPGTRVTIAIPFAGDRVLWKVRPSTFNLSGYPEISLSGNVVLLSVEFADQAANPEKLKADIDRQISVLTAAVDTLHKDCVRFNASAPDIIKAALETKRTQAQASGGAVSALGIPMKPKR